MLDSPTSPRVRVAVAAHPKTPEELLRRLFADPLQQVADTAARNPQLPQDLQQLKG
ncbi:hypothetical protein [Deinococcus sp. QL22]|uniref:hypothetical protein n=1 Tax=Deinococcus sp. QL22 TaxID=2939437 RepID=UPI0035303F19